jgi:hypothetical protein
MRTQQSARVLAPCALALIVCAAAQAAWADASHPVVRHKQQVQARTAHPDAPAPLPRPAGFASWHAIDRDDYEATELDASTSAEILCTAGGRSARFHKPAYACHAAYRAALAELDYEAAMDYAYIGCARHGSRASCRTAAAVPLLMGMSELTPPQRMSLRLKSLAAQVCSVAGRVTDMNDRDVTAAECAHLAQQFVRARDPEYEFALTLSARGFYEAIYDRGHAVRLMAAACSRGDVVSCEEKYALGNHMDPRDVAETVARDEVDRGRPIAMMIDSQPQRVRVSMNRERALSQAARIPLHISPAELDESTETLEREAGDRMRANLAARLCMAAEGTSRGEAATACRLAYQHAQDTGEFQRALRYASVGCGRHRDAASCRLATRLPLHMVAHRIAPGPRFASELKQIGKSVCLGNGAVRNLAGDDVTGRICHHYATLFTPGYPFVSTSEPRLEAYLATVRDGVSAHALHRAACWRHDYHASCNVQTPVVRASTGSARRTMSPNGSPVQAH